jgi:alkylation response protein AidB-like acyl-CoA dehydrogenase
LSDRDRWARNAVCEVVAKHVAPRAADVDRLARFPHESYQALATRGLAAIPLPERVGGAGLSMAAYAACMEEITAACGSTSTVYMTQLHCAHPIMLAGTPEQQQRLVPPLCRGEAYGSLALTEPGAGSDLARMRTVARRSDGGYLISGAKTFISTGDLASVVVLFATIDPSLGRKGITAFALERDRDKFHAGPPMKKLGLRGSSTCELFLDDCWVPESARLGEEGSGFDLSMGAVLTSRISAAAQGIGYARAAWEAACRWVARNQSLDLAEFQDVQFTLAGMRAEIAAARSLLHTVARHVDSEAADATVEVSMAKLHCTALGVSTASAAVELLGRDGDLVELGLERVLRDAKVAEIYDGTNQIQRMLIARDLRRRICRSADV